MGQIQINNAERWSRQINVRDMIDKSRVLITKEKSNRTDDSTLPRPACRRHVTRGYTMYSYTRRRTADDPRLGGVRREHAWQTRHKTRYRWRRYIRRDERATILSSYTKRGERHSTGVSAVYGASTTRVTNSTQDNGTADKRRPTPVPVIYDTPRAADSNTKLTYLHARRTRKMITCGFSRMPTRLHDIKETFASYEGWGKK